MEQQRLLLTGSIDMDGEGKKSLALVTDTDKQGRDVFVVYQRVGVLYLNEDATDSNKQPAYSGPMDGDMRLAAWRAESDKGTKYLSLKREAKQGQQTTQAAQPSKPVLTNDEVPF
jgi:uncharacterized protein (DUF736 family)